MFIGKETDALTMTEGPFDDRRSIGGGTDDSAIATTESVEIGSIVDIAVMNNTLVISKHFRQHVPAVAVLVSISEIGHGAVGSGIGRDDLLLWSAQNIGSLVHEVD